MSKGSIKMIVATDENNGIGRDGDLAWHCKEDLQLFKKKTEGCYIIMGRKTLESLPNSKPLPNRTNVVLCREMPENPITGVIYMHSVEDILEFVEGENAWVIGGGEVYQLFVDHVSEIHETDIRGDFGCDTFFYISEVYDYKSVQISYPETFQGSLAKSLTVWSNK